MKEIVGYEKGDNGILKPIYKDHGANPAQMPIRSVEVKGQGIGSQIIHSKEKNRRYG